MSVTRRPRPSMRGPGALRTPAYATMSPMTTNTTPARKPFYTRWWFIALAVVVMLGAIGQALGGDEPAAAPATTQAATSQAPEPSPEPSETEPAVECLPVAELVAGNLAAAISDDATPARVGAVKSPSSDSYLVAIEISGGPADGLTAIFETLDIDAPGLTKGVDGVAHEFTNLPESAFSVADDASDQAKSCLS